jgi:hypothetical protein
MSYAIASAALSKLLLTKDVPNTDPHQLSEHYEALSEDHIPTGIRFFYCHGLAIALLSMAVISFTHDHRKPPTLRWSKVARLANRIGVCIVMLLLPLANHLRSLHLLSIMLGLTAWVLLVELWGKSCRNDPFIGERAGCCVRYSAKCPKVAGQNPNEKHWEKPPTAEVFELSREEKTAVEGCEP